MMSQKTAAKRWFFLSNNIAHVMLSQNILQKYPSWALHFSKCLCCTISVQCTLLAACTCCNCPNKDPPQNFVCVVNQPAWWRGNVSKGLGVKRVGARFLQLVFYVHWRWLNLKLPEWLCKSQTTKSKYFSSVLLCSRTDSLRSHVHHTCGSLERY